MWGKNHLFQPNNKERKNTAKPIIMPDSIRDTSTTTKESPIVYNEILNKSIITPDTSTITINENRQ